LPGVRGVIDAFLAARGADGLVGALPGWNFIDWVHQPHWWMGMPPGAEHGVSAAVNLQFVLALEAAARLEAGFGDPELSARNWAAARNVAASVDHCLRDPSSGLILDAPGVATVSEHAQALAVLSDAFGPEARERNRVALLEALPRRMGGDQTLARASIYFSFYLFEAWARLGRVDRIDARLDEWREATRLGFRTLRETPEPSRSDCHAWASHPIFHHAATFLGVRPAAYGFRRVRVRPQLPPGIDRLEGRVPHPRGWVEVVAVREGAASRVESVSAPDGVRVIVA
jgi:hypothetical protein